MDKSISVDKLSDTIARNLLVWSENINEGIKNDLEDVAIEGTKKLKTKSPKRTGEYAKGWSVRKRKNKRILFNEDHYRRVHLLENGHLTRNGRRVKGQKHVAPVEEWAIEELESRIEQRIKDESR